MDLAARRQPVSALQEHPYYGSFGYHVTNPFAPASRSGTPEELKALIDEAHGAGVLVLLDIVHSHICKNQQDGLAGFDFGQDEGSNYFRNGDAGYHSVRTCAAMHCPHYLCASPGTWRSERSSPVLVHTPLTWRRR